MILPDTLNVISSPESADGPMQLDLLDGPMIDHSGLGLAPANHSVSPMLPMGGPREHQTHGIFSRTLYGSSFAENLRKSLESRSRELSNGAGSMSFVVSWRKLSTPSGRWYLQLETRAQSTYGEGSTGWPTPTARDGRDISRSNAFLAVRQRHSPTMATRLLEQGAPWRAITAIYCLAMGYPLQWNGLRPKVTATPLSQKWPLK